MKIFQWLLLAFALLVKVFAQEAPAIIDNPVLSEPSAESSETRPVEPIDHSIVGDLPSKKLSSKRKSQ
jgi:hypothetical protein